MNKLFNIFNQIKREILYIINDKDIVFSDNYFVCLNELYKLLQKTLCKIHNIYFKYILYPNLQKNK